VAQRTAPDGSAAMFPNAHGAGGRRASVAGVRRRTGCPPLRLLARLLVGLVLAAAAAGCSRVVAGVPTAAPLPGPVGTAVEPVPAPVEPTAGPAPPTRAPAGSGTPTATAVPGPRAGPARAALEPDVLADECLLDPDQLAALLGRRVRPPEQSVVRRDDGSRSTSCFVTAAAEATPLAAINVYRVRADTPAAFVRAAAAGGRALTGAGGPAAVLETVAGPTLQVAGARYVVTIAVQDRAPDDAAWRKAARAALARLPR
jgi:hypothetical protein